MKTQGDECDGRILLGDDRGGEAVTLRPIRFQCVGVWFSAGPCCQYIHIWTICVMQSDLRKIRLAPDIPVREYGVGSVCM
jgi:hypothetical protein